MLDDLGTGNGKEITIIPVIIVVVGIGIGGRLEYCVIVILIGRSLSVGVGGVKNFAEVFDLLISVIAEVGEVFVHGPKWFPGAGERGKRLD
jgi:hypothetical protein